MHQEETEFHYACELIIDVLAKQDGTFANFTDEVLQRIGQKVEETLLARSMDVGSVDEMRLRISGGRVYPWHAEDLPTSCDQLLFQLNQLVRILTHARTEQGYGEIIQLFPPEIFKKLVLAVTSAVDILIDHGLDTDTNGWLDQTT